MHLLARIVSRHGVHDELGELVGIARALGRLGHVLRLAPILARARDNFKLTHYPPVGDGVTGAAWVGRIERPPRSGAVQRCRFGRNQP